MDIKNQKMRYEVIEEIGRGGMGVVYKAFDKDLKRLVALKVIFENDSKRFFVELEAMAKLQNPSIVRLFDYGLSPNPFFTMEYLDGHTLKDYLQKNKVQQSEIIDLFIQLCEGIQEAHKHKILHRDIKPSNIMICNNQIKIMDFGLAKNLDGKSLSKTGNIVGTPVYMSPEQLDGKATEQSDIYAIGATLYEVLTSRPLYQGASDINIIVQIHDKNPIVPRDLNPDISPYLEAICLKCLNKKPEKRYCNVQALLREFKNLKNNRPIIAKKYTQIDRIKNMIISHYKIFVVTIVIIFLLAFFNFRLMIKEKELREKDASLRQTLSALEKTLEEVDGSNKRLTTLNEAMIKFTKNILDSKYNDLLLEKDIVEPLQLVFLQSVHLQTAKEYEFLRGFILWQNSDNPEQALEDFTEVLKKEPRNYLALMNRGSVYKDMKMYNEAFNDYNQAIKVNPLGYHAYNNRGLVYMAWNQYTEAIADFSQAISINDRFATAYRNRGLLYQNLQQYSLALDDFEKAIDIEPENYNTYNSRGYLYYIQKKYTKALNDYEKALSLNIQDPYVFTNYGLVYHALGNYEEALKNYNKAISLDKPGPWPYNSRGTLYKRQKKYEEALSDYAQAISIDPGYIDTYINRGELYRETNQYQEALADYNSAIALNANDYDAIYGKGFIYYKMNDYPKTIHYWQMAIDLGHPNKDNIRRDLELLKRK